MNILFKSYVRLTLVLAMLLLNSINSRADTVYVWSNDGMLQKLSANGVPSLVTNNLSGWNGPVGLVCDNVGNLYAGVPSESYIWKFSPDGTCSQIGYIDSISGLAFDSTGNLYATSPNYVELFKPDYGQTWGYYFGNSTNYTQSHLSYPANLLFDSAGNILVANNNNAIEKFSTNFTHLGTFATNFNNPSGMAFDGSGNLFVANSGTNGSLKNTIEKITTGGVRFTYANASSGLSSPQGLAFDSATNLYVANSGNGTILKFAPDGSSSVFASGLNTPSSIAVFPGLKVWSATPAKLNNPMILPGGAFQFGLIENSGLAFTVLATTNVSSPLTNWTTLGSATEVSPGVYHFTDPQATNNSQRFYKIRSP